MTTVIKTQPQRAVVIGGSLAGLLTARVLSDHFAQVTLIERDPVTDRPEPRKGQPHTHHLHGLLAKGYTIMSRYFPDLPAALLAGGAIPGDMGTALRWYTFGGYRRQYDSGLTGVFMSRPFLEGLIRQRVLARPNIELLDQAPVERLLTTPDGQQVIGVEVSRSGQNPTRHSLTADLVVDASGRGSASPKWLAALGYPQPQESLVKVGVGYATRLYRRRAGDLTGAEALMITPEGPRDKRMGLIFPIEQERWICTLGGWAGDHAPNDAAGFMAFARSLPVPDLHHLLSKLEPLSDIRLHKFPANLRRHYEKLTRFPDGFLVLGDAVCSFNPVYGQGMTSAAMQAEALDELLTGRPSLAGLWRPFFKQIATVIDIPWQLAVGEDFRFRETEGRKAPGTDLINAYVARVHRATHTDPVVYGAFLKVMNLMAPPTSLFQPRLLWRVLRPGAKARSASQWQPAIQN